jgi:hypothetical protein
VWFDAGGNCLHGDHDNDLGSLAHLAITTNYIVPKIFCISVHHTV